MPCWRVGRNSMAAGIRGQGKKGASRTCCVVGWLVQVMECDGSEDAIRHGVAWTEACSAGCTCLSQRVTRHTSVTHAPTHDRHSELQAREAPHAPSATPYTVAMIHPDDQRCRELARPDIVNFSVSVYARLAGSGPHHQAMAAANHPTSQLYSRRHPRLVPPTALQDHLATLLSRSQSSVRPSGHSIWHS